MISDASINSSQTSSVGIHFLAVIATKFHSNGQPNIIADKGHCGVASHLELGKCAVVIYLILKCIFT